MEKRVFLAIFLSFVVLAVYQSVFAPRTPAPVQRAAETAAAPATAATRAPSLNNQPRRPLRSWSNLKRHRSWPTRRPAMWL
jgi:hypothetical protein